LADFAFSPCSAFGGFSILVGKPLNHTGRKLNEFCRFVVNGPNDLPGASYGLESGIISTGSPVHISEAGFSIPLFGKIGYLWISCFKKTG